MNCSNCRKVKLIKLVEKKSFIFIKYNFLLYLKKQPEPKNNVMNWNIRKWLIKFQIVLFLQFY